MARQTLRPSAVPAYPKWAEPAVGPIARLISMAVDTMQLAERTAGPALDLFIRVWLAESFLASGLVKAANWQTALLLATYEYPVSWLDPHTAAVIGLAIELICPSLIALGLFTRIAAIPLLILSLVIQFAYKPLHENLFWAVLFGVMILRGAGALSLDRLLGPAALSSALPLAGTARRALEVVDRVGRVVVPLGLRLFMAALLWPTMPVIAVFIAGGLAVRLIAAVLFITLAGAGMMGAGPAEQVYWLMVLGLITLHGAGRLSLDELLYLRLRRIFPQVDGKPAFSLADAPHVVIVGAGFGGLAAARSLRWCKARVTLIDRRNYHLFQPLLYQVATASLSPADIATPIRTLLRQQFNTTVHYGRVTGIDRQAKAVLLDDRRLSYDYLVLATGARHDYFGKDEWEDTAPGLKKIDDATAIRRRILVAFERAEACADDTERAALLTFVVVGAGPTGVELSGAIAELARQGMERDFRRFDPGAARVILVQAGPRVLPTFPETLSARAKAALEGLGIEVRLDCRVSAVDAAGVMIGEERIAARTVLWAAGVAASPAAKWLGAPADRAGRIKVRPDLSVPEAADVFAIGDTALIEQSGGMPVPGLAPAARQGGEYVARVIRARIEGRAAPGPFRYRHLGSMATIGRKAAIAELGSLKLWGMPAWWLWGVVHVAFLVGARNRFAVMLDWAWAYLTYRRSIRLITGAEEESTAMAPTKARAAA
jgi:NADH dehydrogenase/putative oxidoreductase